MAVATKLDIIEGAQVASQAGRLVEWTRIAEVSGLTGGTNTLNEALTATGMPVIGDAHPDEALMVLEDIVADPNVGDTNARLALKYRYQSRVPIITGGGAGLEQVLSNVYPPGHAQGTDPRTGLAIGPGKHIVLGPHPSFAQSTIENPPGTPLQLQGGKVSATDGLMSFTMMNVLDGGPLNIAPIQHCKKLINTVNQDNWIAPGDAAQYKIVSVAFEPVLWERVVVSATIPGENGDEAQSFAYHVIKKARYFYDFQFKEVGWNPITIVGVNKDDGQFVTNLEDHPGAKRDLVWYRDLNFAVELVVVGAVSPGA